jgi:hypothetical protein
MIAFDEWSALKTMCEAFGKADFVTERARTPSCQRPTTTCYPVKRLPG